MLVSPFKNLAHDSMHDHRRMSEPAIYNQFAFNPPPPQRLYSDCSIEPIPLSYTHLPDDGYGPSPPGTGTSTSSNPANQYSVPNNNSTSPLPSPSSIPADSSPPNLPSSAPGGPNSKTYSFVSLPGNAVKKRPRRRYDEIERLYQCSWPDCTKAYGTLNHLNAHVTMQKHGTKRSPNEFKELRKQWRKAKKEELESRSANTNAHPSVGHHSTSHSSSVARRMSTRRDSDPDLQTYSVHRHHNHPSLHSHQQQINPAAHHRLSLGYPSVDDPRFDDMERRSIQHSDDISYMRHHHQQRYGGSNSSASGVGASWQAGFTSSSTRHSQTHSQSPYLPPLSSYHPPTHSQSQIHGGNPLSLNIPGTGNSSPAPGSIPLQVGHMPMNRLPSEVGLSRLPSDVTLSRVSPDISHRLSTDIVNPLGRLPPGSSDITMNRLPPDSTLLTPLPGYEPPAVQSYEGSGSQGFESYSYPEEGRYAGEERYPADEGRYPAEGRFSASARYDPQEGSQGFDNAAVGRRPSLSGSGSEGRYEM